MDRITRLVFILLAFTFLCSCLLDDSLQILASQKNAAYKDTVLLGRREEILGYDPETLELKIRISTNTLVTEDIAVLEGDRAVFGDTGSRVGVFGRSLGVLGPSGRLDQTVEALPNPCVVVVDGSWLLADSAAFDSSGNARFSLYNASNMRKIKEFTGFPHSTANDGAWIINGIAYIGVESPSKDRSFFVRYDIKNNVEERIYEIAKTYPNDMYRCLVFDDCVIVLYSDLHVVEKYKLPSWEKEKTVALRNHFPELNRGKDIVVSGMTINPYCLRRMTVVDQEIIICGDYKDDQPGKILGTLFILNKNDLNPIEMVSLEKGDVMTIATREGKVFLKLGTSHLVSFDVPTRTITKTVILP